MYHSTPAAIRGDRWRLPLERFREHLDVLLELGWRTMTLSDLMTGMGNGSRAVALTFDDGYADNMQAAALLADRGMTATWFAVSAALGSKAVWADCGALMTRTHIRELHAAGHEIGSHTRTHPRLDTADEHTLRAEVDGSRRELEDILGAAVTTFAYPYGRWSDAARAAVAKAGYRFAASCRGGAVRSGLDPLLLPRLEIDGQCSAARLARVLALAAAPGRWRDVARYVARRCRARLGLSEAA